MDVVDHDAKSQGGRTTSLLGVIGQTGSMAVGVRVHV